MYEKGLSRGMLAYIYKIQKLNFKSWWCGGNLKKYGFFENNFYAVL